jgi:hypothetical protein
MTRSTLLDHSTVPVSSGSDPSDETRLRPNLEKAFPLEGPEQGEAELFGVMLDALTRLSNDGPALPFRRA